MMKSAFLPGILIFLILTLRNIADADIASDEEIAKLTEHLFANDVNNLNKYITIDFQGKTHSSAANDQAPNPLLQVDEAAFKTPTMEKFYPLLDNYILDTSSIEDETPNEKQEENEFLDVVMETPVMKIAMNFLEKKGIVKHAIQTQRELLKTIWFTMYSRGGGRVGSSGFEHVFVAEMKDKNIMGLHNWVYYYQEEKKGNLDYKGYLKKLDLGDKGALVKYRFDFHGISKPVNGMFIGTSPELEMALYTVCFMMRENKDCIVSANGNHLNIRTYSFTFKGKNMIGSAFPEIM